MASRDKDPTTPHHQPLLSSLVVRPSDSDAGGRSGGSDYEPGEVRRDPPPYSRTDRYSDDAGYRIRAGSISPGRRRESDRHFSPHYDHPSRGREFERRREFGRHRDSSPPYGRGRGGARPYGRGFDRPGMGRGSFRGEGVARNNPNVRPREGDWYCSDPMCGNLNFARREFCNNCKRPRYGHRGSPRRGHLGPPPPFASRRLPGHPMDRSPPRPMNGYRSPPRGWARDGPRDFPVGGLPPPRHEGRFPPDDYIRRDRLDYPGDDYRGRNRAGAADWDQRDRGGESLLSERKSYERRPLSPLPPPVPPSHDRWARDVRERSRSPIRGLPPKDYHQDLLMDRARDERRGPGRDRIGNPY